MMTLNEDIFRFTGPLCGNSPVTAEFPSQRPVTWSFDVSFDLRLINGWVNKQDACDLRHHRTHYDVTVMLLRKHYFSEKKLSS